ncbi:tRNA (adenosine(37)-N6)-threonylcarbamoyltransferase complex ATPase subunit type 1 TsaE [Calidifontimicrobium sp. SYSU G02091]|uniref:tRNA (adenosine(37)-N6)-threonylcarbamoyltransferase complex ATPase subunit type 1 TsaE n=1 Tax=Calidifontimicrobium sp. SYSU G02091 TaxID=2926421 RepID=UPI001F532650|nr:tRNA (adenosine(37)-N6)-threonylcarbamoyltransferase complex ATPase subunit type 1 TsaE [Calidifontimicrobium sp. SYSU G02091]MCI1193588.1 tRNA (adenosine(37)-N6)-threonylcarbamoyltransferase complex ATPase subunit type 1 TsaE [Calidifontimicrobium sp. SYSU G02091]
MTLPHRPILETRTLDWPDEAACAATAAALAAAPELRDATIELRGALGAGKTTFVRHLLRALGVTGRIKSPTYALMEPYEVDGLAVSHFDFYRFADPREWVDAGLRDVFAAPGLKLVEWPEQAAGLLPPCDLRMELAVLDGDRRRVTVLALSPRGRALLAALAA